MRACGGRWEVGGWSLNMVGGGRLASKISGSLAQKMATDGTLRWEMGGVNANYINSIAT